MASTKSEQKDDNPKYPTITRAELAGGYFNKHVAFVIKTPSGAEIKRRYTDFEWLRHLLRQLYPGAFIPPIPPKLPVAMWPQGYLLMRKRELQQFLQRLEVIPYLKKEEVTNFFLTNHGGAFDKARKKWEKGHPKASDKALYDKLVATFPSIHETKTPDDMDKRCQQSTQLIDESLKQLKVMVKASEQFIEVTKECCDAMGEFKNCFEGLTRIETEGVKDHDHYFKDRRVDVSPHLEQWKAYKMEEINHMNTYYVPTLNRALNDLTVIKEILDSRDRIQGEHAEAKRRADVWNSDDGKQVRSSDLARKHREVQREEDLRNLRVFVEKLVLGQLNVVFCANTRRWKKSCNLFASKHLVALEKVLGSWKSLANKILKGKGDTDAMHKAVVVEEMDTPSNDTKEDREDRDEEKRDTLVVETLGNDPVETVQDAQDELDKTKAEEMERQRQEQEERERKEREEEEERLRIKKELWEEEERKKKEEEARIKKEKEEELKREKEKNAAKMKEMFQDDDKPADNEFPWEDDDE